MSNWIGIDPGQTGGIAVVNAQGELLKAMMMPAVDREVDAVGLFTMLNNVIYDYGYSKVAIEQVHSMPGQGVSSSFKFGKNFGIAIGVVGSLHLSMHRITPQKWKKQFVLTGKGKDASRGKATEFWPEWSESWKYKYQNGITDAALIAECARRTL